MLDHHTAKPAPRLIDGGGVALPPDPTIVAWDADRGVFLIEPDHPEWKGVRATYDQLVFCAPPIVTWGEPNWLIGLRRLVAGARR